MPGSLTAWYSKTSPYVLLGYILGVLAFVVLGIICFFCGDKPWFNFTILVFAAILGWVVGILATPDDAKQEKAFTSYFKIISVFLSGFVVAKVDIMFAPLKEKPALLTPELLGQFMIFGSGFLLGILFTFIGRTYLIQPDPLQSPPPPGSPAQSPPA